MVTRAEEFYKLHFVITGKDAEEFKRHDEEEMTGEEMERIKRCQEYYRATCRA